MNRDEYVPITTPRSKAKVNPLITSPPKRNITSNTKNVLSDVLNVRLRVLLSAILMISVLSRFLYRPTYSLILSKTTTVSLIE